MANASWPRPPDALAPLADSTEITVTSPEAGRITAADGFGSFAEPVRRVVTENGRAVLWLAGKEYCPEEALVATAREPERARGDAT